MVALATFRFDQGLQDAVLDIAHIFLDFLARDSSLGGGGRALRSKRLDRWGVRPELVGIIFSLNHSFMKSTPPSLIAPSFQCPVIFRPDTGLFTETDHQFLTK